MTQAIIVAAGKGSRLYPITDSIPKVMIPVGKQEKPMGQLIIEHCMSHGINDFLFCLNKESGKQVINYFGDGSRFGIVINYSLSDEPQGTSGEVKLAYDRGLVKLPTLIYYGDTLCQTDLSLMMASSFSDVTVVVNDEVRMQYGFIEDLFGRAENIIEKPRLKDMLPERSVGAIMSIYYVKTEDFFSKYCRYGIDISGDVLPGMMGGYLITVFHDRNPFIDVGNWQAFTQAKKWDI